MGLTKQYLRYVPGPIFNVIASVHANAVFVQLRAQAGRYVAVAGCENALIWDTRTVEKVNQLANLFMKIVPFSHAAKILWLSFSSGRPLSYFY